MAGTVFSRSNTKAHSAPCPVPIAEPVLTYAWSNREVIREYNPLTKPFPRELCPPCFRARGNQAFLAKAFVINNDGTLARSTSNVNLASRQVAAELHESG